MSRRKRARRIAEASRPLYLSTFMLDASLRFRISSILDLGVDPGPRSASPELEQALTALAAGESEPELATAKLIAPVELAVAQLFHLRDAAT